MNKDIGFSFGRFLGMLIFYGITGIIVILILTGFVKTLQLCIKWIGLM